MTRAILVLGIVAAGPAHGQVVANLTLTLDSSAVDGMDFGTTADVVATIQNNGPSTATGVTLKVAVPAGAELVGFSGCTPDATDPTLCNVPNVPDFTSTDVTFTIGVAEPDPIPETCPASTLASADVTLTAVTVTAPQTASYTVTTLPYARLKTTVSGPATANQGQAVTYLASVTNLGPCTAPNAVFTVDYNQDATPGVGGFLIPSNPSIKGTDCTAIDQDAGTCTFGDMVPNAAKALAVDFTVDTLPAQYNFFSTGQSFSGYATSDIYDPGVAYAATTLTTVPNSVGGCTSAEGGGLLGMLALLGLAIRRRFR